MKVRQHIPNFFSGFEQQVAEAGTLEELLAIEFVDRWTADPHFYRFSVEWNYGGYTDCHLLMAETHKGKKWWVVAYLTGPIDPIEHLPKWTGGKERL